MYHKSDFEQMVGSPLYTFSHSHWILMTLLRFINSDPCFLVGLVYLFYYWLIGQVGRVFTNEFNPRSHHTKNFKNGIWYLLVGESATPFPGLLHFTLDMYLILLSVKLSNIRYISRVKWSNPGKGVALSPTPQCRSYWKGSLLVALNYSRQQQQFNDISTLVGYLMPKPSF